ncbi:MAG: sulfatase [Candidatus Cryptobacteroides sp.]
MTHKRNTKLLLSGACMAALCAPQASSAGDKRPNIIFIMSDDHTSQAVSAYNGILSTVMPTPNIDRIGKEGAILQNCFVTNSISTPSRAAIITGQYSQCNGVYTLNDQLDPEHPNVAKSLQAAGYQTAIVGKWHLHAEPTGFDWYNVLPGQGRYNDPMLIEKGMWPSDPKADPKQGTVHKGHSSDVIGNEAIKYLDNRDKNKPFFLMCHFKAPHRPWTPAERFNDLLNDVQVPEPDNILDTYEGKGKYTELLRLRLEDMKRTDVKRDIPEDMDRDELRHWIYQYYVKDYLRCVAGVDENVGRILKYLDDNGLADNTVVIYTGDQGFFLGEHGWFDKRLMYDECLRMPFLIRYPKEIKAGTQNKDMVMNIDFAPLFLDYAGVRKPSFMQGLSFRSNLTGKTPKKWRDAVYYRYWMNADNDHNVTANYGIRTDRYKLIFYYGESLGMTGTKKVSVTPEWELYDLESDPMEMHNVYNDPNYSEIIESLKYRLLDLKKQYNDEDVNYPVMQNIYDNYYWK